MTNYDTWKTTDPADTEPDYLAREEEDTEMASDLVSAQMKVDHNMYVLNAICDDLVKGWYGDAHEHRCISGYKRNLEFADFTLRSLIYSINNADTSREGEKKS